MHRLFVVFLQLPLALVLMWSVVAYAVDVAPTRGVVKDEAGNLRCVDYNDTHRYDCMGWLE